MEPGILYEDTLNKKGKHDAKNEWWAAHGVRVVRTRFDGKHGVPWSFGDYAVDGANVVVDSKASIAELYGNLCRDHERFKREVRRANEAGCLLVVLVETNEAADFESLAKWLNVHCLKCTFRGNPCDPRERGDGADVCLRHGTKKPLHGDTLAKQVRTMEMTRCVRFEFVPPDESARRICDVLGVMYAAES